MGEVCSNGATWGTRAGTVGSCAQAPDGTGSSQASMEAGSGKALEMPSTVRSMFQAQKGLEPSGEAGCLERGWDLYGLVPTHHKGASLDLSRKILALCLNPTETGKTSLTWPPRCGWLRPSSSASTNSYIPEGRWGQGMKQVIRGCGPKLGC